MFLNRSPEKQISKLKHKLTGLNRAQVLQEIIRNPTIIGKEALLGAQLLVPGEWDKRGIVTKVEESATKNPRGVDTPYLHIIAGLDFERLTYGGWIDIDSVTEIVPQAMAALAFADSGDQIRTVGPSGEIAFLRIPS